VGYDFKLDMQGSKPAQSIPDSVQDFLKASLPWSSSRHNHIGAIEAQNRPLACGVSTGTADDAGPISPIVNNQSRWQHGDSPNNLLPRLSLEQVARQFVEGVKMKVRRSPLRRPSADWLAQGRRVSTNSRPCFEKSGW